MPTPCQHGICRVCREENSNGCRCVACVGARSRIGAYACNCSTEHGEDTGVLHAPVRNPVRIGLHKGIRWNGECAWRARAQTSGKPTQRCAWVSSGDCRIEGFEVIYRVLATLRCIPLDGYTVLIRCDK